MWFSTHEPASRSIQHCKELDKSPGVCTVGGCPGQVSTLRNAMYSPKTYHAPSLAPTAICSSTQSSPCTVM